MDQWTGEEMDVLAEGKVEVLDNKYVHLTHDESTFYRNDGREELWVEKATVGLGGKDHGGSIMISDFLCPGLRPMKVTD